MENAAQAVGLALALGQKTRLQVSESAVRQGLLDATWPGRLEKVSEDPRIVLDGAHNVESVKKMLEGLKRHFDYSAAHVVFASSCDKDAEGMLSEILAECKTLLLTEFHNPRATPCRVLAENIPGDSKKVVVRPDPRQALLKAVSLAGPGDLVLVMGSLFLVGELRQFALEGF